jgi:nicotinamide-nucleotide amidase
MAPVQPRHLLTAEIMSVGTELTVGDTRDTNAGELARALTALGVRVTRLTALPDDLDTVTEAFRAGLERADLVVSTGGLGPTPDDLTREAIATACGETPAVDPELEAWLRELWQRRGMPFPELNLKQAWLIPSATALPNPNGTAPGWFVSRADGRVLVALPGPPREMRPMWVDHALPGLQELGIGSDVATRTYRLTGIGESQVAERLGEILLRATNPIVATYARAEAVDIRISATAEPPRTAEQLVEDAAATVLDLVGDRVWATGQVTWSQAIGSRLDELGWTLAAVEIGTSGSFGALLGDAPWFRFDETIALEAPAARAHTTRSGNRGDTGGPDPGEHEAEDGDNGGHGRGGGGHVADDLIRFARRARELGGAEVGVAIRAHPRAGDTTVSIAVSTPAAERKDRRVVFLTGALGRSRSALAAAAFVLETLRRGSGGS